MPPVIIAHKLVKRYGDLEAVSSIEFSIEKGECFGFLGPNGAGKTTAMKLIQTISPVTSGKLEVLGMDVKEHPKEIKARIGVAPQENNLDPDFTTIQNLTVYARYFGIPSDSAKKKASELLEFMHLSDKKDSMIDSLSGGMKRRLIVARALVNDPEIVILDEPTTGLDPQARHMIWDKVRELKKRGVTIILTTHYMDEAEQLCDRLVIMEQGRIIVEDTPSNLIKAFVGKCVMELQGIEGTDVENYLKDKRMVFEKVSDRIYIYSDECETERREINSQFPNLSVA